jgi:deazaflavin-dependent oxidoreductase (nitroreductase family)
MMAPVSALLAKILPRADVFILRITDNRHTFAELVGLPIIQLTTIGAKTNLPRTKPLVGLVEGEKIALIASSFGRAHNPGWYYNLKKHPECDVLFNGRSGKYIARELEGDDYEHYWQLAVSYYAGYEKYKERAAHRHIPVMLLEPKK